MNTITVNEYSICPQTVIAGTQGSEGVFGLSFSFDASWAELAKKAVFLLPNGERIYRSLRNDAITIPREVMQARGKSRCFLVGRQGKRRLITVSFSLLVLGTEGVFEEVSECRTNN